MHQHAYSLCHGIHLQPCHERNQFRDRGLPLLAAQVMFNSAMVVREDKRKTYPERRFIGYSTLERRMIVSKRNLKLKAADPAPTIDWAAVDAAPLAGTPDEDSPELTAAQFAELRPLREVIREELHPA